MVLGLETKLGKVWLTQLQSGAQDLMSMTKIQKRTLCALRQLLVLELRSALRANTPGKQSLAQVSTQLEHWLEQKVKVKV